jgi:hypothetical protein
LAQHLVSVGSSGCPGTAHRRAQTDERGHRSSPAATKFCRCRRRRRRDPGLHALCR